MKVFGARVGFEEGLLALSGASGPMTDQVLSSSFTYPMNAGSKKSINEPDFSSFIKI
jgi:hypothetical protein